MADLIFGDPEWFPHPVRVMGRLISFLENRLRANAGKWVDPIRNQRLANGVERIKGIMLIFTVVGISASFAYLSIELLRKLNPFLGSLAWVYLGYTTLSIKDLRVKAREILKELEKDSLIEARKKLSKIVSRDTQNLSKDRIILATVESIAESTNDGIVAPLFYLILGGPVLAITYKAINTLDSMVGYKNEKYLHFGWFPARLDDIVNFIPARISGLLISLSSFFLGKGFKDSFKTMLREGKKHPSPNSGISEAAMAGAIGIKLGGDSFYQGKLFKKPFLGESKREVVTKLVNEALAISLTSSILMVILGVTFKWMI